MKGFLWYNEPTVFLLYFICCGLEWKQKMTKIAGSMVQMDLFFQYFVEKSIFYIVFTTNLRKICYAEDVSLGVRWRRDWIEKM